MTEPGCVDPPDPWGWGGCGVAVSGSPRRVWASGDQLCIRRVAIRCGGVTQDLSQTWCRPPVTREERHGGVSGGVRGEGVREGQRP